MQKQGVVIQLPYRIGANEREYEHALRRIKDAFSDGQFSVLVVVKERRATDANDWTIQFS
jgi:hypothetical protein